MSFQLLSLVRQKRTTYFHPLSPRNIKNYSTGPNQHFTAKSQSLQRKNAGLDLCVTSKTITVRGYHSSLCLSLSYQKYNICGCDADTRQYRDREISNQTTMLRYLVFTRADSRNHTHYPLDVLNRKLIKIAETIEPFALLIDCIKAKYLGDHPGTLAFSALHQDVSGVWVFEKLKI